MCRFSRGHFGEVSPLIRLIAAIVSSIFTSHLLGISMYPYEIYFLRDVMEIAFVSLILTVLCVAALTNAINMIDGCNGLASGFALITLPFFLLLSLQQEKVYVVYLICFL